MDLSELLKILADHNRLRILALLENCTPCVCDLEAGLAISQSNLSRHLNKLRAAGLVSATKKGLFVYYRRIEPDNPVVKPVLDGLYAAMGLDGSFAEDKLRFDSFIRSKPTSLC